MCPAGIEIRICRAPDKGKVSRVRRSRGNGQNIPGRHCDTCQIHTDKTELRRRYQRGRNRMGLQNIRTEIRFRWHAADNSMNVDNKRLRRHEIPIEHTNFDAAQSAGNSNRKRLRPIPEKTVGMLPNGGTPSPGGTPPVDDGVRTLAPVERAL